MDKFLEMKVFSSVVEAGSFTGATHTLDMSKAAVSRYVAELEERLGVRLLHRTTRKLSPTTEGEIFLHAAGSCWATWMKPKPKSPRVAARRAAC